MWLARYEGLHGNGPPPNSDNSGLGAHFALVPLWTALETTSKSHAFYALATSTLGTQSSLFESFGLLWDAFGDCLLA